jgi:hypothetical protein
MWRGLVATDCLASEWRKALTNQPLALGLAEKNPSSEAGWFDQTFSNRLSQVPMRNAPKLFVGGFLK